VLFTKEEINKHINRKDNDGELENSTPPNLVQVIITCPFTGQLTGLNPLLKPRQEF